MQNLSFKEYSSSTAKPKYLMVLIHGYGSNGSDLISLAPDFAEILPDMHFVSPNGIFPFEGGGSGFQWYSLIDRSVKKMKHGTEIALPIINDFIDKQLERFNLDDSKLIIAGFSQGGMLSIYCGLNRHKKCAGIMSFSGYILNDPDFGKEIVSQPPIFLSHGMQDQVVTYDAYLKTSEHLEKTGFKLTTYTSPTLGHGIDMGAIKASKAFLKAKFKAS